MRSPYARATLLACVAVAVASTTGCGLTAIGIAAAVMASSKRSSQTISSTPPPSIASITPTSGSHSGGTVITVTGSNFASDATVSVGGVAATNVTVSGSTSIRATVSSSTTLGAADVTVTNLQGGTATLAKAFTYTDALPTASVANLSSPLSQNIVFAITVADPESDPANLLVELDQGSGFTAIPASQFVSGNLSSVPTSPNGTLTHITWDSRQTVGGGNAASLRIRVTPTDTVSQQAGTPGISNTFSIVNNTAPTVQIVQPAKTSYDIALRYSVSDPDGDAVRITGLTWQNARTKTSGSLTIKSGQAAGSCPNGSSVTTVWDSLADLGYGNNQLVTVTVTVSDGLTSASATTAPFFVSNGPLSDESLYELFGSDPQGFCVGDFTGDGLPDLVACEADGAIAFNVNRGTSFDTATKFTSAPNPGITAAIGAIVCDPSTSGDLYAGSAGLGVFASTNAGGAWTDTKIPHPNVDALAADPSTATPNLTLYAGTYGGGVYKTTNGGTSWSQLTGVGDRFIGAVAVDPNAPVLVYAGTAQAGAWVTTNGGTSWSQIGVPAGLISCLAVDPTSGSAGNPSSLVYAGSIGSGLYVTTSGPTNPLWTKALPNATFPQAQVIRAIAVDTTNKGTVYVAAAGVGVLVSSDSGSTWTLPGSIADPLVYALAIVPQGSGKAAHLYAGTKLGGLYASADGGATWSFSWLDGRNSPILSDLNVFSIAVDPTNATKLFAGTQSGQLYASTNGGVNWTTVNGSGTTGIPQGPTAFASANDKVNIYQSEVARTSECKALDVDGDGKLDLVAVDSIHSPNVDDKQPLLNDPTTALLEVLTDLPNDFANVTARTATMMALQVNGAPDFTNATYQSCQASFSSVAPLQRLNGQTGGPFSASQTGLPVYDELGWFPQAVLTANLDRPPQPCSLSSNGLGTVTVTQPGHGFFNGQEVRISGSGSPALDGVHGISVVDANTYRFAATFTGTASGLASSDGGRDDLVVVHGVRQAGAALTSGDVQGCVVIRQVDPTTNQLGPAVALDPTDMGLLPVHAAIGDVLSSSRNQAPWSFPTVVGTNDIVVANAADASLTFYLQYQHAHWDPAYTPPTFASVHLAMSQLPLPPGKSVSFPQGDTFGVALGDVNGDGANDLVVVGQLSKTAIVLVYDPNPTAPLSLLRVSATKGLLPFRVAAVLDLPSIRACRPAIGQLTGNRFGTILIPSFLTNDLLEFIASGPVGGTPTFSLVHSACDFQPFDVAVADLNADRRADVVVVNQLSQDFSVSYQSSPGTLDRAFVPVPTGIAPFTLATGDVTGDGIPEVACTMAGENGLWVFGRSAGGLAPIATYDLTAVSQLSLSNPTSPSLPFFPVIGDTTGTGRNDIVLAMELMDQQNGGLDSGLEIIRGAPLSGSVAAVMTGTFGPIGFSCAVGDVNGDGIPDIVLAEYGPSASTVFLGQANGSFVRVPIPGAGLCVVAIKDVDGDGWNDIVAADGSARIRIIYGPWTGPGLATPPPETVVPDGAIGESVMVAVGDMNNDGLQDVVIAGFTSDSGGVLFQTAPRVFTPVVLPVGGEPAQVAIGDLNGDGLPDVAMVWAKSNVLAVYYQNPSKTGLSDALLGPITFPTSNFPQGCAIVDVDGDGRNDVVVACRGANSLNIFFQR